MLQSAPIDRFVGLSVTGGLGAFSGSDQAVAMHEQAASLLAWWTQHGRDGIPWKCLANGEHPEPHQDLDPYGIWIAEVMRCSAA